MRQSLYVTLFLASAQRVGRHVHRSPWLRWLLPFGGVGLFALAVVDSSLIPLPIPGSTDLVLILLVANRNDPFLMAACAIAGSILGGYLSWSAGQKGGSIVLHRYVPNRILHPISKWIERRGRLSVSLAALLPPPIPLMPVLVAAGTLGVSRIRFLTSFSIARTIRYGLLAWLAATYGRKILNVWSQYFSDWAQIILSIYIVLLIVGVGYGLWKYRRSRTGMGKEKRQEEETSSAPTYRTQASQDTRSPNEAARRQL